MQVQCISCGRWYPAKHIQNGHYFGRKFLATRFDEDNCYPQCMSCNVFNKGNYPEYTLGLIDKFGAKKFITLLEKLDNQRKEGLKISKAEYEEMTEDWKVKVKKLLKKNGVEKWWQTPSNRAR